MRIRGATISITIFLLFGCAERAVDVEPAGDSFFPLAVGNRWIYQVGGVDGTPIPSTPRRDTVEITGKLTRGQVVYFQLEASWPGFEQGGLWVYRGEDGNLQVTKTPGQAGSIFLKFDAEVGQRWPVDYEFHGGCLTSLGLIDDYAVVNTPAGRFDGAREIGGGWIDCTDFGWAVDFARGVGPVRWEVISFARPTNWVLLDAHIADDVPR